MFEYRGFSVFAKTKRNITGHQVTYSISSTVPCLHNLTLRGRSRKEEAGHADRGSIAPVPV